MEKQFIKVKTPHYVNGQGHVSEGEIVPVPAELAEKTINFNFAEKSSKKEYDAAQKKKEEAK